METVRAQVDQWTQIGGGLAFAPTDIEPRGVRLLLRGEVIGGPEDGATIDRPVELRIGSAVSVGIVVITLISARGKSAKLSVVCPPHMGVKVGGLKK